MPEQVHTGGGAHIDGSVEAGTFIGRDMSLVLSDFNGEQLDTVLGFVKEMLSAGQARLQADPDRGRLTVATPDGRTVTLSEEAALGLLTAAARRSDEQAYLAALRVNPRYGRWARQFVPLAGMLRAFEGPPGAGDVPVEFILWEMAGEGQQRQLRSTRVEDITQALQRHDALVVLGEPGAGKTTTLQKLALEAAEQRLTTGEGRLPLFLPLANYRGYASPYAFVQATWQQFLGGQDLEQRLRGAGLQLLCDALNELPFRDERQLRQQLADWRQFVIDWPGNQIVFTCRKRDYSEPLGLPQVEIERLDNARVQDFLAKYLPADLSTQAWDNLKERPLLDLVRNPYYLRMLAYIVAEGGAWPKNRAGLFDRFVSLLILREKTRQHPDWLGSEALCEALSSLAESIQPMGQGTRLLREEALQRIPRQAHTGDGPVGTPPQTVLRLGLCASLLDSEKEPTGKEWVRFYHHQLQEYFAARAVLERFVAGQDLSERWRQPRRVMEMPDPGPLGDLDPLPPPPPTGWEEPTILAAGLAVDPAAFVQAVSRVNWVLAARCLSEAGLEQLEPSLASVRAGLLEEMRSPDLHLRARIAAGEALGQLGDPRWEETTVAGHRLLLPPLVHMPAGASQMGSSPWQVWLLRLRGFTWAQDELPRHQVQLPEFWIGQYPVTNAEFACFVEDGGYQDEGYWRSDQARAWLRGEAQEAGPVEEGMRLWQALREDPSVLQRLRRAGWSPVAVDAWQELSRLDEAEVREALSNRWGDRPRDRPGFWEDPRFNQATQPVVGVNWYEASAYCAWLDNQLRSKAAPDTCAWTRLLRDDYVLRLPSEAEWECAARWPGNSAYPWGNRWKTGRANTLEGHVLRTTPVGVYTQGATPAGVHDLSGNVWEWTTSLYQPYPCHAGDGRNEPQAQGPRVVRGGSWFGSRRLARCAFRDGLIPDNWVSIVGFRVVVSLARPEF
ncbi:MAG: NACHT domain-containing protein [Chloroflexi bacterium]|nr:NACHT domain-containing protein [Chloroflexota bacterium]